MRKSTLLKLDPDSSAAPPTQAPVRRIRKRTLWKLGLIGMGILLIYVTFSVDSGFSAGYETGFSLKLALIFLFAAFVCEYFDSSLGMGYGTTLTPLLMILGFAPLDIIPAVMFSQMVAGLTAGFAHHTVGNVCFSRGSRDLHVMWALVSCSLLGGVAAVYFTHSIPELYLRLWIGVLILSIGIYMTATRNRPPVEFSWRRLMGLGLLASFNKGSSGGGYGPLVMGGQILSGVNPRSAVGITALGEALTCIVYLAVSFAVGHLPAWRLAVPLGIGALISVPLAAWTVRLMPPEMLRGYISYVTIFLGLLALTKVAILP